jgi:sugar (pentulose or hexulose) kinase
LCADVFEVPVVRPAQTEAAALGAARQARWVVDSVPVDAAAVSGERFEPASVSELRAGAAHADALRAVAQERGL